MNRLADRRADWTPIDEEQAFKEPTTGPQLKPGQTESKSWTDATDREAEAVSESANHVRLARAVADGTLAARGRAGAHARRRRDEAKLPEPLVLSRKEG
jgi:hypothetical protein